MENIYSYGDGKVGTDSICLVPRRSPGASVQEGELTDEFIVNYMYEMESCQPEYSHFQLTKFSDAMTDVGNIAREVTSHWNGLQDYGSGSPLMVTAFHVPEESTYPQSSPSSYATSSYTSPDGNNAEEDIVNSPNTLLSGSQVSDYLHPSAKQSLYESTLLRSPAELFEEPAQAALLAGDSYPASSRSQILPASVLTGDITAVKRGAQECQEPLKKKRGRKPKSEAEKAVTLEKRKRNSNRIRVYEIEQPFEDKEMERKRINAVNSKKHRDQQKQQQKEMEKQLADASIEREIMKRENDELKKDLDIALRQLDDTITERDVLKLENEELYKKLNAALTQLATIQGQYSVQSVPI